MAENVLPRDFHADRQVNFLRRLSWIGKDFTSASFLMQVRAVKDTTGTPLLDLANATFSVDPDGIQLLYAGTATIAAHIAAGRLSEVPAAVNPTTGLPYASADNILLSELLIFIGLVEVKALPFPQERGDDLTLYYDLLIMPAGGGLDGQEDVAMTGKFIVRAGVSILP